MLPEWRLLDDGIHEARHHFAVEEAIARSLDEGLSPPTLRLRRVNPAVFVGVNQNTWDEVNMDYCLANNIQVVRRMNGGGAVYQEMGSFCFSAFFNLGIFELSDKELYRFFAEPVIRTCADYGVAARFAGRNDVVVGNRKIFGSAQFSFYQAFVQSGTFLINMNFDAMTRALTPPKLKFADKSISSIRERVTSLSYEVGQEIDTLEVMDHFANHVTQVLGIRLTPRNLTTAERELADQLYRAKYNTDRWNFGTLVEFQLTVAEKIEEGVISVSADIEGNVIQKIRVNSDVLRNQRQLLDDLEQRLVGNPINKVLEIIQDATLPVSLSESLSRLFEKLSHEFSVISSVRSQEE